MTCEFDHVNLTVVDIERATEFLTLAFPDFRVRGGGESDHGDRHDKWIHLGTDDLYVCLNETTEVRKVARNGTEETGLNHVGFIVDDVDDLLHKYEALGLKCAPTDETPSRKRLYVTDHDALTWEFVEYLSDDPAVRNDYSV